MLKTSCWAETQPAFSVTLSSRPRFTFMSWTFGRKNFHPTTNDLNLLFYSSPGSFISLVLQTHHIAQLPPLLSDQFKEGQSNSHSQVWLSVLFTANPQESFWNHAPQSQPPDASFLLDVASPPSTPEWCDRSSSSLTQRILMCPSLISCSAILPLMLVAPLAFPPFSFSFPAPWHYFFIHLHLVKLMPILSEAVARAELMQKYLSAGSQQLHHQWAAQSW